ncbi:MAG: tetratricopeptide repeat protein, partial [Candidatus Eisenbacteria bacterium]|nr:tetratricopeptide repeat protein [Candidatus Eisenbacteria bacterium]
MRFHRMLPLLLALLLSCFAAPVVRAGGMSDAEYAKLKSQLSDLVDAQRYAAADSLLKPWWARVVPDSAKHPGPAGRIVQWQATIYSDSWSDSARLPGSWTPAQSYDWLVVASRLLLRGYGNDSAERMEELRLRADIARDLERYALADSLGRERIALARRVRPERPRLVALALLGLAASQSRAGEYRASNACLDSALAIYESMAHPDTSDIATALNGRASNWIMLRADDAAERDLLAALDLRERTRSPQYERAQIIGNLAIIAYRRGDAVKAADLYTRSYDLYRTNDPP